MEVFLPFLNLIEAQITEYSCELSKLSPKELYEPEKYILSLNAKRLRPLLTLIACDLFEKNSSNALHSALSVELFHNFSLIHDDILDNAPIRRGKATVHQKWGNNIAILSGDAMLVKAFQAIEKYDANEFKQLHALFSKTALEVCEGQQEDMNFETRNNVNVAEYIEMISKKTAVLLGCALQMGAINAGATIAEQEKIYLFGKNIGIAFQLIDDYLDAFALPEQNFGKQIGGDIIANKKTYLSLKYKELLKNDVCPNDEILNNDLKIKNTIAQFKLLKVDELCLQEAEKYTHIAMDYLLSLNKNKLKTENLISLANTLLYRKK
ncbi:MAG: polyprenyl synthetase family protein [Bacteroidetes bacterium]|nr:polyprenyl synthetase family protein [Bacteroidota bacterium]